MTVSPDLTSEALQAAMPGRPVRCYPALVSTGAAAHGWATEGAPDGAVVIAGHQLSPRGHAGRPLEVEPGRGLGFSVVLRPALPAAREGFLYTIALTALVDVLGSGSTINWPDEVRRHGAMAAAVAVRTRLKVGEGRGPSTVPVPPGGDGIEWAVLDVLLPHAAPPRGPVLGGVLEAIEARSASRAGAVLGDYDQACETIGRQVSARLRAGTGPSVSGWARETLADGALVLELPTGAKVPVRPQDSRGLEQV